MFKHIKNWCMVSQFKTLPYSSLNYMVSEHGDIYQNNELLKTIIIDQKLFVEIEWISGKQLYEKAILILTAFGKSCLSASLYDRIEVIYKDGDTSNCFPSNLTYVFKDGPIESSVSGYYLVPEFEDYAISRDGILINLLTGNHKKWCISKGTEKGSKAPGYHYTTLYKYQTQKLVYQHRLLCLVFKKITGILSKLTVNHINCIKSDNRLVNLEWSTYSENNKHAWNNGLKLNNRPHVLMRDLTTEKVLRFRSVRECSYYLGDTNGFYVSSRLNDVSNKVYPDYLMFKRDDGSQWPELDLSDLPIKNNIKSNCFVAKNVFTGECTRFDKAIDAKHLFDIEPHIVLEHARCSRMVPHKGYNFRFLYDSETWPNHTKHHLEIYKDYPTNPNDGIFMIDTSTNEETFFTGIDKCIKKMGIHKSHLHSLIHDGRMFQKRYKFRNFKLRDNL